MHGLCTSHARMGSGMEPGRRLWPSASSGGDERGGVKWAKEGAPSWPVYGPELDGGGLACGSKRRLVAPKWGGQ